MTPADCPFCRIIAGQLPAQVIDENDHVMVFLSLSNRPMVVPKRHIPDIHGLDQETGARIMAAAVRVAKAMKQGLECDGIFVSQANGTAAGQEVFHYHLHLDPRWHGGQRGHGPVSGEALAARIRAALVL